MARAHARSVAGSGIGLAVVDQLVSAHGGSCRIVDCVVGTTVEVDLPLVAHGADQPAS
ncbi:MAG: ATP-binding protein [Acidimicrobiia bacterium]